MRHERICRLIEIDNPRIRYYSVSLYDEPEPAVFGCGHFADAADAVILHIAKWSAKTYRNPWPIDRSRREHPAPLHTLRPRIFVVRRRNTALPGVAGRGRDLWVQSRSSWSSTAVSAFNAVPNHCAACPRSQLGIAVSGLGLQC